MADFMLHNTHTAKEHDSFFSSIETFADAGMGSSFFCSCPSGNHGAFFQVQAASASEALAQIPQSLQADTSVFAGELFNFPA